MTQDKHTAEPWELFYPNGEPGDLGPDGTEIWADERKICEISPQEEHGEDIELGRRIVACVNACAGISTADLESGAVKELLDALQEVTECFEAAYAEGLNEKLCEATDRDAGSLYDLIVRRLVYANHAAMAALAKHGAAS